MATFDKYLAENSRELPAPTKTGSSIRTNALKIDPDNAFGDLFIDRQELMGGRLVAYNKFMINRKVMSRRADVDLVHLLTKRFNPRRNYSRKSRETFNKLMGMANISQESSKSCKCAPVKYYKSPNELIDRLELLLAAKESGNDSVQIINESVEIIDTLLKTGFLTRAEYGAIYASIIAEDPD